MQLIFIFLFFVNLINILYALVCPIYRSYQRNFIEEDCHRNCKFYDVLEKQHACIGVYYNYSGNISIKQLGIIPSDEQCLISKQCILDIDPLNSQSSSCCCSTDNCTLNWQSISTTTTITTTYRSILINNTTKIKNLIIIDQDYFSWKLFLIIFILIMIIILITFTFGLWKSLRNKYNNINNNNKNNKSLLSTSIEQLFFSLQEINIGKNSIVYKGLLNHDIVAVKIYKQINILIWKNEVTLLKSIKHESIIKILSEGQYNSHLYLILPFYENGTLQSYLLTPNRKLSINQCLIFFRSLASAISYLHMGRNNNTNMSIVHRDIKSSNILIDKNELNLYLTDFGVALVLPQILTEKDFVQIGTIRYMAPELLEGVITHTHEALCSVDIYALALVMWEIITQCDVYPTTVYRPPYEEYRTNNSDGSSFATEIYDIVVVRRLRPTLIRQIKDNQHALIIRELCSLIDACWITDSDIRMNAQTLAFKLNQLM
ncbi:unnamed protein product [Rotaria sordida]|uniref:receptor protein serine/threonine kinase n=1 Tax=Rotaria sordida TaxID=392033 RepID=A0A814UJP5_9BILA|nr:unnamed protein product [Rotaria sordida]CAF1174413.1 unnamed protein product [Rotaria sordida]CAF1267847.1 unnamed protein product [Rotaria sordida]